jgi:hypothetical protein
MNLVGNFDLVTKVCVYVEQNAKKLGRGEQRNYIPKRVAKRVQMLNFP